MSLPNDRCGVLIVCPYNNCVQVAEIYDSFIIPPNQTSSGHVVLLIRSLCVAEHRYHGELKDGMLAEGVTP